ncbi:phage antirepressor KilAC domain-containing protein [Pandoraea bronchicola]
MERKLERQAERFAEILRRAGEPEAEVQRRVQRAFESARNREANRMALLRAKREAANPYAGCRPVTDVAREFHMRRFDLFEWLERAGWLYRAPDGWRPTDEALSGGWVVLRGRGSVRWVQLAPEGVNEIARRIGITGRAAP